MQTALIILIACATADLILCAILLAVVWIAHRRQSMLAAAAGEPVQSAASQFGCLAAFGALGFVALYGTAWLLLRE